MKKVFLKILQNLQVNTCARTSVLIKFIKTRNFIKRETLFSFEIYGIFKNTFFTEHLWTTASELSRHLLEMHSFTLEVKAVVSLLLKAIPKIKIHVTPVDLHLKAICFKLSRWF